MSKQKILLINDNRDVENWGCRATSASLVDLLEKDFVISEKITKLQLHQRIICYPVLISKLLKSLKLTRFANFLVKRINNQNVLRLFGIRKAFLSPDINQSISRFYLLMSSTKEIEELDRKIKNCDLIVINGEGSIIFTPAIRDDFLFQAFIVEIASRIYKKPVYYVNSMVSEAPDGTIHPTSLEFFKKYFSKCELITTRDPHSMELVKEYIPEVNVKYIPDALFSRSEDIDKLLSTGFPYKLVRPWIYEIDDLINLDVDFSKPYICIGGTSVIRNYPAKQVKKSFEQLISGLSELGIQIVFVENCIGDRIFHEYSNAFNIPIIPVETPIWAANVILANAVLFISGRYHPSIMASMGGTPCIFWGSNSHKTRSLQTVLGYTVEEEFQFPLQTPDIEKIISLSIKFLKENDQLNKKIKRTVSENRKLAQTLPIAILEMHNH